MNACIYPAVLLGAGLLVMLFLMGYVVPRFSSIYEDVGADLPFASRVLLQWGQLMDAHAALVAVALIGALGRRRLWPDPAARPARRMATWVTRIPAVGRQLHLYQLARLYRTAGMLLRGGMPAVTALQMSAGLLRAERAAGIRRRDARRCARDARSRRRMESNGLTTPVAARMLAGRRAQRQHGRDDGAHRLLLRRGAGALGRGHDPPDRAAADDGDRPVIGVIVVLMYFPIFQLAGSIR